MSEAAITLTIGIHHAVDDTGGDVVIKCEPNVINPSSVKFSTLSKEDQESQMMAWNILCQLCGEAESFESKEDEM